MSDRIVRFGGKLYAVTPASAAGGPATLTPVKPVWITQAQLDDMLAKGLDKSLASMFKVRTSTGTVRAARKAAVGGTCPYFGQDYITTDGIHHPADCGKEHDGKFAVKGTRSSAGKAGSGYEGHIEWASRRPTLGKA